MLLGKRPGMIRRKRRTKRTPDRVRNKRRVTAHMVDASLVEYVIYE
jgi:hypothetical protein